MALFHSSASTTRVRCMDEIAGFLAGPRARGAFLLKAVMEPPWSLSIEDQAPLSVVVMVSGSAWIGHGEQQRWLGPGDLALIRGPEPYVFADSPASPVQVRILPGQLCVTPAGESVSAELALGLRA